MVSIAIKLLSTLAHIVLHVVDDTESQFPLEACDKILVLESILFFNA
jgi:hypothetical protein